MMDTLTPPKPKARRRVRKIDAATRRLIEQAIETMINALDARMGDIGS